MRNENENNNHYQSMCHQIKSNIEKREGKKREEVFRRNRQQDIKHMIL